MSFETDQKKDEIVPLIDHSSEKVKLSLFKRKEISDKNNSMILENDSLVDEVSDQVSESCKDHLEQEH